MTEAASLSIKGVKCQSVVYTYMKFLKEINTLNVRLKQRLTCKAQYVVTMEISKVLFYRWVGGQKRCHLVSRVLGVVCLRCGVACGHLRCAEGYLNVICTFKTKRNDRHVVDNILSMNVVVF